MTPNLLMGGVHNLILYYIVLQTITTTRGKVESSRIVMGTLESSLTGNGQISHNANTYVSYIPKESCTPKC